MTSNESELNETVARGRPPGRPRKQYRPSGRKAANASLMRPSLESLSIPSGDISAGALSHPSESLVPSVDRSTTKPALSDIEILSTQIEMQRRAPHSHWSQPASLSNNSRFFLNAHKRSSQWRELAVVRTLDLVFWFDMQMNDYGRARRSSSDLITFEWFGHPGDSPFAANTRRFLVHWVEPSPLSKEGLQEAILKKRIVHRWKYRCTGTCSLISPTQDDPTPLVNPPPWSGFENAHHEHPIKTVTPLNDEEPEECIDMEEEVPNPVSRDHRCEGDVELALEIRADNLGLVRIYQYGMHDDALPHRLGWSKGLRNEVLAAMMNIGAQPKRIYEDIVLTYNYPQRTSLPPATTINFPSTYPTYRRPTRKQVYNLLPGLKRRGRLDEDPFRAMDILALRNPKQIYNYSSHNYQKPDKESDFTCALTSDYALESLILHGTKDGVGMDTSWRNKNENRAGVTIIVAVDTNGHLTPGAVLLSANIKAPTLLKYIQETKHKVIERAKDIIADPNCIKHKRRAEREEIIHICSKIVAENTWTVHKWMIDKCKTSLHAILQFHAASRIYICQFHIIQAIQRLDGDSGRVEGAPRMPYRLTYKVIRAFRRLQRCRNEAEWPSFRERFRKELSAACHDEEANEGEMVHSDEDESGDEVPVPRLAKKRSNVRVSSKGPRKLGTDRYNFLIDYFDKYWFSDRWLRHVTDMSLPQGKTRDGSNNTNNWAESAFLVFDKVFLDMRKNKRIDRLGAILLNEWFLYYEESEQNPAAIPARIQDEIGRAYDIWDSNWIDEVESRIFRVRFHDRSGVQAVNVNLNIPRCSPCDQFEQTGRTCVHMRAAVLYERNGSVRTWLEKETETQRIAANPKGSAAHPRQYADHLFDAQMSKLVNELLQDPEYTSLDTESTDNNILPAHMHLPEPKSTANGSNSLVAQSSDDTIQESGFRSGFLLAGRPARITPLTPRRAKRKVTFQLKRGPKRQKRGKNSLFLKTQLDAIRKKDKQLRKLKLTRSRKHVHSYATLTPSPPQTQFNLHGASVNVSPLSAMNDKPLTQEEKEETEIYTDNLSRWDEENYTLRIEEMDIFVKLLNSICQLHGERTWIGISGENGFEKEVANALTLPDRPKEGSFASNISDIFTQTFFLRVIFVNLSRFHWTIWDYYQLSDDIQCMAINPMKQLSQLQTDSAESHWVILNAIRRIHKQSDISAKAKSRIKPVLTGLQTDSAACGFWTVFLILLSLLKIPFHSPKFSTITISQVKKYLKELWIAFLQDPGVDSKFLKCICQDLGHLDDPTRKISLATGHIVARRPPGMASSAEHNAPQPPPNTGSPPVAILPRPAQSSPICHQLLTDLQLKISIGSHKFGAEQIRRVLDMDHERYGITGQITDSIVNAYLSLIAEECEVLKGIGHGIPDFLIADTLITDAMSSVPVSNNFKPSEKKIYWFPKCNIFEKDLILLPWFLSAQGHPSHWVLVTIRPARHELRMYDSAATTVTRKHTEILKRVRRVLEYEHSRHYPRTLVFPKKWGENQTNYFDTATIKNDQQTDGVSCGIYMLQFCSDLCHGKDEEFARMPANGVAKLRCDIGCRFAKFRRPLTPTQVSGESFEETTPLSQTPTPSSPSHPTSRPTLPNLRLAEFPMDVASAVETRRISSQLPKLPIIKPTPLNRSLLRGLEVGAWHMWKLPSDGLFYPGQIKAIDDVQRTFKYVIPSELIYKADTVPDHVVVETFRFYLNTKSLDDGGLRSSQIGIIRWPAVLDDTALDSHMQVFAHGTSESPLWKLLSPQKQAVFSILRGNLTAARNIYLQKTTTLAALHEDWLAFRSSWPSHKRSQMAFEFVSGHLALLDRHDRFIIQHIAMWDFLPRNETSQNMDTVLGLGQSIFGYLCLAHYLRTTPDAAYLLHQNKQIIRPRVLHEEAWKIIESSVIYENQQDWTSFRTTHRVLDTTLELPKLKILSGTHLTNSDPVTMIAHSSPKPAITESSRSSSINPATAKSSRSSSINPEPIIRKAHDVASESNAKYSSPTPVAHDNDNQGSLHDDLDIPVAQRRAKRQAVLNHAFIKSGV